MRTANQSKDEQGAAGGLTLPLIAACSLLLQANGDEEPPAIDVEGAAAAAMDAVARPTPPSVSDWDVLSALMKRGEVSPEAIVAALAAEPAPSPAAEAEAAEEAATAPEGAMAPEAAA